MVFLILILVCFSLGSSTAASFPYTLQWKRLVPGVVGGALVQRDSLVFVGTADGRVMALGSVDGIRRWQRRGFGPVRNDIALVDGAPVFADAWGGVQILSGDNGEEIWTFRRQGWGDAALVVGDDKVYASGSDGWLYALDRADGREVWRVRIESRLGARACIRSGRLYAPTADGRLLVLNAERGILLRTLDFDALVIGGVYGHADLILAAFADGYVRAYDQRSLDLVWQQRLGAKSALTFLEKTLLCAADNGWLYGLSLRDGRPQWKQPLGGAPTGPAVEALRGEIVVGTEEGRVIAVEPATGERVWDVQLLEGMGARLEGGEGMFFVRGGDDYLYAFAEVEPLKAEGDVLWESWWEVLDQGRKIGYRRQELLAGWLGDRPVLRLAEEVVHWRGGFRRSRGRVTVGRNYQPISVEDRAIEGSQVVEFAAHWRGDSLHVERGVAEHRIAAAAKIAAAAVPVEVALLKLWHEGRVRKGRRDSLYIVDYDYLTSRKLRFDVDVAENLIADARFRVRISTVADSLREERLVWVDAKGRPLRQLNPRTGAEELRVDETRARSWVPPGRGRSAWLSHPLEDPSAIEELVVVLPDSLQELEFVEDRRQELRVGADGRMQLIVRSVPYAGRGALEIPIRGAEWAPYLESSLYIQAADPRIRALALRLRGTERDAWKVALRLRRWVYDHMVPRNTNVRFKSTLEVLEDMEGTCSEYAVLFIALCRSVGLPARAAVGFLVAESGELVLHIWAQIYAGEWIDLDPSWSAERVDAAHIKTGQGLLTASELRRLNGSLLEWLAQVDTLELVEYRARGQRFSSRAEDLFTEAREAEKNFDDARAQELFHQITLLTSNQRNALALVNIARYRLQRGELDDAEWALERLLRLEEADAVDDGLFHLARLADAREQPVQSRAYLERLVRDFPDGDLADDALGELATKAQKEGGCQAALPYYQRLCEEYSRSGWASVAKSALERCARENSTGQ